MSKLIGGLITLGLVALLSTLFLGSATLRFDLIVVKPAFWCFLFGIIFTLGGGWLAAAEIPAGGLFATLGAVLLLLGGYKSIWPNTSAATSHAQEVADVKTALAINKVAAPKLLRCDRDSKTQFWDPVTGKPVVYYALNTTTHRIECADAKGYNTVTRQEFREVNPEIVELILAQSPPAAAVVAEAPAPKPATTPIPDLSEGPIDDIRR